jgi:hypothetical protein
VAKAAAKREQTDVQAVAAQKKDTTLLRRAQKFEKARRFFMPRLPVYLAKERFTGTDGSEDGTPSHAMPQRSGQEYVEHPERFPLLLPSAFSSKQRDSTNLQSLAIIESQLRYAQMEDALAAVRIQLRTRSYARKLYRVGSTGQRHWTRSKGWRKQVGRKIDIAFETYNAAYNAYLSLNGVGEWQRRLKRLRRTDLKSLSERFMDVEEEQTYKAALKAMGMTDREIFDEIGSDVPTIDMEKLCIGEGNHEVSWIWHTITGKELEGEDSEEVMAGKSITARFGASYLCIPGVRVEWLKLRARAARWREEVLLLDEEMRRAIEFCDWKQHWWQQQVEGRGADARVVGTDGSNAQGSLEPHILDGIRAYALQHADVERKRADVWDGKWELVRQRAKEILKLLKSDENALALEEAELTVLELKLPTERAADADGEYALIDPEDDYDDAEDYFD